MPISKNKIILGIDPGLAITGLGVISANKSKARHIYSAAIISNAKEPFGRRLQKINSELVKVIKKYKPEMIALEQLFFAKNVKTALKVGEARGVAYFTAWKYSQNIKEYTPLQVKQALTGYGLATKTQVQKMVMLILGLKKAPHLDDIADALAVAICCSQTKDFS